MNTFGVINWRYYYKKSFPVQIEPAPCESCPYTTTCRKSIDPQRGTVCWRYVGWFRRVWPVVTGKKKAASSGANTENGKGNNTMDILQEKGGIVNG